MGLTTAAFEANKVFILKWFNNAIQSNAFEELTLIGANQGVDQTEHVNGLSSLIRSRPGEAHAPGTTISDVLDSVIAANATEN